MGHAKISQKKTSLKMSTAWQRNLRRSDGCSNIPKAVGNGNRNQKNGAISKNFVKTKRLSSVSEATKRLSSVSEAITDDVFADENIGIKRATVIPKGNRRKLSTKGSISEVDNVVQNPIVKSKALQLPKSPQKIAKAQSFLRPIPKLIVPCEDSAVKNVPSPIPLPKGVTNIDPDDESTQIYGRDIFNYVLIRDAKYVVTSEDIIPTDDPKLEDRREHLVDWIVSVAHYFKTSQETFYHTVDILDRCLSKVKIKTEYLQLLGVASFLIATKLDEYHPANINDLCRLTENSVTQDKMLAMEQKILMTINFETYGTEPMTFIRRYLKAAQLSHRIYKGSPAYELSILFMDAMVLKLWDDDQDARTSKK